MIIFKYIGLNKILISSPSFVFVKFVALRKILNYICLTRISIIAEKTVNDIVLWICYLILHVVFPDVL